MGHALGTTPDFNIWSDDELRLAARVVEVPNWDSLSRQEIASQLQRVFQD